MSRYVISDIHGCSRTVRKLVENLQLTSDDQLYFLGDYIDRGPSSSGVLDFMIELQESNLNCYFIRGNHEENMLYAEKNYNPRMFMKFIQRINKSGDLLNERGKFISKYRTFIQSTKLYYELNDFWLVHAGFDFRKDDILEDEVAMLEIRKMEYDAEKAKGKRIVHGHQVTYFEEIQRRIDEGEMVIALDNGCVYRKPHKIYNFKKLGTLCCLNLDTMEIIQQKCLDK